MNHKQNQLSRYIDQLNNEKKPNEHGSKAESTDHDRLLETVRRVRLLREMEYPQEDYPMLLTDKVKERLMNQENAERTTWRDGESHFYRRIMFLATAAVAAAVIILVAPKLLVTNHNNNIVYAMEKAFEKLEAYHGTISVIESNELGDHITQSVREVWADREGNYYVKELEGTAKGIITINNGEKKWQLRPQEKTSYLFAAFPDPYRFTFELAQEIDEVKDALDVREIGEDIIAGRSTTILQVTPEGGSSYQLWVDKETKLPLQRETAMQNAIRYQVAYTTIEFIPEIPKELLQYQIPNDFSEVESDAEQVIGTLEEAEEMIGFRPIVVNPIPSGYSLSKITIQKESDALRLYYTSEDKTKTVRIDQSVASGELKASSMASLGKINGNVTELLVNANMKSIRWQEDGVEFYVLGDLPMDNLMPFLEALTKGPIVLPHFGNQTEQDGRDENKVSSLWKEPEIKTEVDPEMEESEQKSVDAGHSPWKLDPVFVTQVFASLLLSPEGITGEYPISYEEIEIIENDGTRAIAWVKSKITKANYVYLERLVRQDETGIWTVIGYDRAN